eukprot:scaffold1356_cov123-Cylindrotheca_fusiformis.AAC.28
MIDSLAISLAAIMVNERAGTSDRRCNWLEWLSTFSFLQNTTVRPLRPTPVQRLSDSRPTPLYHVPTHDKMQGLPSGVDARYNIDTVTWMLVSTSAGTKKKRTSIDLNSIVDNTVICTMTTRTFRPRGVVFLIVILLVGFIVQSKTLQRLGFIEVPADAFQTAKNQLSEDDNSFQETPPAPSSQVVHNKTYLQDEKCKRAFEWSMIDHWEELDNTTSSNNATTMRLKMQRNWRPTRNGNVINTNTMVHMSITIKNSKNPKLTVIDARRFDGTQSPSFDRNNVWHRMVPIYNCWIALQTAERRYNLVSENVFHFFDCEKHRKTLDDLAREWEKVSPSTCDRSVLEKADIVIVPPLDGFLWDLAWDFDFECHTPNMFMTFANLFVNKSSSIEPTEPMGCLLSRKGRPVRTIGNWDETLSMMKDVFPRVQDISLTAQHTTDETAKVLEECRVLFGVHGAGHMNAMFTRPGVAVVEMIGNAKPAYYRNINMLLGQYYESIHGDSKNGMKGVYTVNLTEAREALVRAKNHASSWILEHGHWR